jgi:hypothetical protein
MGIHNCPLHGVQGVIHISPDLRDQLPASRGDVLTVYFVIQETIFAQFTVSRDFARANGITQRIYEYSDDDPPFPWESDLVCMCVRCFEDRHDGKFIDFEWTPNTSRSGM